MITFINISGLDPDAKAFLDATAITDATITRAINTLVIDLKGYGIWSKCLAIYPMVGGTATTHMYNLKDPQNTNAAFRLLFSGGWTHSATGALPNGTNAFADTFLIPNTQLSLNSTHISVYSRTNTNSTTPLISDQLGTGTILLNIFPRFGAANEIYFRVNSSPTANVGTNVSSAAFYLANRVASGGTRNYRNTTQYLQTQTSGALSTLSLWLSRQGSAYGNRQIAFSTIGEGLTDQECTDLYNTIQTMQTTLSRNV